MAAARTPRRLRQEDPSSYVENDAGPQSSPWQPMTSALLDVTNTQYVSASSVGKYIEDGWSLTGFSLPP